MSGAGLDCGGDISTTVRRTAAGFDISGDARPSSATSSAIPAGSPLALKMLTRGASQPWQDILFEMTGEKAMDASAILEYFAPLKTWLEEQNKGQKCGW